MERCIPPPLIYMRNPRETMRHEEAKCIVKQESTFRQANVMPGGMPVSRVDPSLPSSREGWQIIYQPVLISPHGDVSALPYFDFEAFSTISRQQQNEHDLQSDLRPQFYSSYYWQLMNAMLRKDANEIFKAGKESPDATGKLYELGSDAREKATMSEPFNPLGMPTKAPTTHGNENPTLVQAERKMSIRARKKIRQGKAQEDTKNKPFRCHDCNACYRKQFELNRHFKVSHIKPHKCPMCDGEFGHKNYLRVHMETVHEKKKNHGCGICGKFLSTAGNLSVHIRTIHFKERKYKCEYCSKTFGQQCNMKTHMKRHENANLGDTEARL